MGAILACFGLTDRGKVRRLNEGQFLIAELTEHLHVRDTSLPKPNESEWSPTAWAGTRRARWPAVWP